MKLRLWLVELWLKKWLKTFPQKNHPEQRKDEIFLGNFAEEYVEELSSSWKSWRRGKNAYNTLGLVWGKGREEIIDGRFPVFVTKKEWKKVTKEERRKRKKVNSE